MIYYDVIRPNHTKYKNIRGIHFLDMRDVFAHSMPMVSVWNGRGKHIALPLHPDNIPTLGGSNPIPSGKFVYQLEGNIVRLDDGSEVFKAESWKYLPYLIYTQGYNGVDTDNPMKVGRVQYCEEDGEVRYIKEDVNTIHNNPTVKALCKRYTGLEMVFK